FYAHIGGMDAFARGLKIAAAIREDGGLDKIVDDRYATWDGELGQKIESGEHDFKSLETILLKKGDVQIEKSGRQEFIENYLNRFI
ncbi:MAG: xylose isomerase, partial [Planctomycetota bacterium]